MTFRISSLPAREYRFEAHERVSSPPPGASGTTGQTRHGPDGAAIVDLTEGATRAEPGKSGAADHADAKRIVADLQRASFGDPSGLIRAQEAPSASRVLDLLR